MVACLQKPQHPWETTKKKFRTHCLAPRCVAYALKMRKPWIIYFYIVPSQKKLGTLCLVFLTWSFVFLVRLIAGWLKDSTLQVIAQKETSYGNVRLAPFCGAFGKKWIVEFFKIAIILLILFELCCNTQLLGGVRITPNTFVIIAFQWFSIIGRLSFLSSLASSGEGPLVPCP